MSEIRLGFIGAGMMGQVAHLRNYVTNPRCEVVALAELRPQLARAVAARYGIAQVYADHRDLLAHAKVDALVVIQQFMLHGQLLPDIIARGLPMLVEKPLGRSVEVATRLAELAEQHHTRLHVAYHKRSDPACVFAAAKIREWRASGRYGPLHYIRITMPPGNWVAEGLAPQIKTGEAYPKLDEDPHPPGYDAKQAKDFFWFVNYYIHQINLVSYLAGEDYEVVTGDPGGVYCGLRTHSGVSGLIEMAPYKTTRDWQESVLVAFQKAWLRIDLPAPLAVDRPGHVTVFQDAGGPDEPLTWSPILPDWHAMRAQADNFLRAVAGETTPLCDARQAVRDLVIARSYVDRQIAAGAVAFRS